MPVWRWIQKRSISLLKSVSKIGRRKNFTLTWGKKGPNTQRLASRATTTSLHAYLVLRHLRLMISHTRFDWYCIWLTYPSCNLFGLITGRSDSKQASQTWGGRTNYILSDLPYPLTPGSICCRFNLVLRSICGHFLLILGPLQSVTRDWTIPVLFTQSTGQDQGGLPPRLHAGALGSGPVFSV